MLDDSALYTFTIDIDIDIEKTNRVLCLLHMQSHARSTQNRTGVADGGSGFGL